MHVYDVYRCGWASFHYGDSPFLTGLEVSDFTLWAISPAQGPLPYNSPSVSISAASMVGVYPDVFVGSLCSQRTLKLDAISPPARCVTRLFFASSDWAPEVLGGRADPSPEH